MGFYPFWWVRFPVPFASCRQQFHTFYLWRRVWSYRMNGSRPPKCNAGVSFQRSLKDYTVCCWHLDLLRTLCWPWPSWSFSSSMGTGRLGKAVSLKFKCLWQCKAGLGAYLWFPNPLLSKPEILDKPLNTQHLNILSYKSIDLEREKRGANPNPQGCRED